MQRKRTEGEEREKPAESVDGGFRQRQSRKKNVTKKRSRDVFIEALSSMNTCRHKFCRKMCRAKSDRVSCHSVIRSRDERFDI